uniref:Uncharacterized protein n=1 Tax=Arundo donax TaxID=35708 RepID=A0A0A9BCL7_ARUDO
MIPAGCAPLILALFPAADSAGYEPRAGCLKGINEPFITTRCSRRP